VDTVHVTFVKRQVTKASTLSAATTTNTLIMLPQQKHVATQEVLTISFIDAVLLGQVT